MPFAMTWLGTFALLGSASLALAAVWTDLGRREIPHWILAGMALLWLAAAWLDPRALNAAPWASLACGAGGLALGFLFHALGWLGGGDGKLLAVLALWLGPGDLGLALLATGALVALLALAALARPKGSLRRRGLPCALAISPPAATLLAARALA